MSVDSLTVGCRLLLPHVSAVLQYLSGVVRNSERLKKKKFRTQVSKELNVLSKYVRFCRCVLTDVLWGNCVVYKDLFGFRISRFVTDKQQSSTLISLLLPYLHKPNTAQVCKLGVFLCPKLNP